MEKWNQLIGAARDWIQRKRLTVRGYAGKWATNEYVDATGEFVMVFILSSLPFGVLVLSYFLTDASAELSWNGITAVLRANWKPGEILLFVSVLLAPFCYVMYQFHRARRHMPGYRIFLIALLLMYPGASVIFAHDKLAGITNTRFVENSSLILYVLALIIWYFGLAFQRKLNKPPKDDSSTRSDKIADELSQGAV